MIRRSGVSRAAVIGIIVVVIILAAAAFFLARPGAPAPAAEKPAKVFYVIAYHWGFAFYDSNLREIDKIVVNKGDRVKIYVFPAEAFSEDFHHEFEEKAVEAGVGDLPPGSPEIEEEIEKAEEQGLLDHGFAIKEFNVNLITDYTMFKGNASSLEEFLKIESKDAIERHSVTFVADKVGEFDIFCSLYCGYGHNYMIAKGAFVVRG